MKTSILFSILFCMNIYVMKAQNTLLLNNGKKIAIGEYKIVSNDFISYKTLKDKFKSIETYEVFSIIEKEGHEIVIYKQDSLLQGSFDLMEMRAFVQGQSDAIQNFKSPFITAGGIAVAGISSVIINPVFVIPVSGVYCGIVGITKTSEKKMVIPENYKSNEHYLLGYKKECKHKRIKNAIIGSGIGLVVGFTTFVLVNK